MQLRKTIATLLLAATAAACEYRPAQPASSGATTTPVAVAAAATASGATAAPTAPPAVANAAPRVPLNLGPGVPHDPPVVASCAAVIAVAGMS